MTNNPTFKPGDVCWHVRHGKVTLVPNPRAALYPLAYWEGGEFIPCTVDGKRVVIDVGRVLYTLAEAAQYGWHKPEPLRVEFETAVHHSLRNECPGMLRGIEMEPFIGKRVKVTIEEVHE